MTDVGRSSTRRNRARVIIAAAAAIGVVHLLVVDLGDHAPLRAASRPDWPDRVMADRFADADAFIRRAAAGHNLQLVIESPERASAELQNLFTELYFRAAYTLLPKRVFVGDADRVINSWDQLSHTAKNPASEFLAVHDVRNVLTLTASPGGEMSLHVGPAK